MKVSFIIHIASFSSPAGGKSFDLYTEMEEAKEYAKAYDEPCIQVLDNDGFEIPSELSMSEYCEFIEGIEAMYEWDKTKAKALIHVEGWKYYESYDLDNIDLYSGDLSSLAEQFVDDGIFGDIPSSIASYIDYEKIARDL
jgi:hypothetical protein